ncbi:MAG: arginine--tRNA ligase [Candidatus Yanofskybacteria bacterium RIFCSPLOWO2_01_FULL_49_17]|uniref:Arginine--tRNA ligase n=1 Tax=Candidatus Yanofskybacteria bacterium RIFCSPLOWO2_01_FULL_49_17 TaxID=1802700 RepID=A0A1F8GS57_9BACT|nr:MAG: arginine--tRNA ligase [Candidatus Yanofskybacteria bacterium RIFCSPLOWO2_01_FULL_49_17]
MIRRKLQEIVSKAAGRTADILMPPDAKLGDYSTNIAFVLAKEQGKKPAEVAEQIKSQIEPGLADTCDIKALSNGYLNFFLKPGFLQNQLSEISKDDRYGQSDEGKGKTIIVEYSSPNIAKPMHIGHLRSTIIGDALANIYEALGYKTIRWNYIGDWGTQFGKVLAGYKKWGPSAGSGQALEDVTMADMLDWYVRAGKDLPEEEGQKEFKKLEEGDAENKELWKKFRDVSLREIKTTYQILEIHDFDVYKGESDYDPQLGSLIEELERAGKIKESEGALIFDLDKYNLPLGLLRKSDRATLYLTRDLASMKDRLKEYNPDTLMYVVANQQALHFEQLFAIAHDLKINTAYLVHVKFGMVLGEDGKKLATREGKVVPLQDVIEKITALAGTVVKQKNPELDERQVHDISHVVGIGALKYNDLKQHPYSDIAFDWKAMLDLSGNSGPYLQYTYSRLVSILKKSEILNTKSETNPENLKLLTEPTERALMKQLLDFPDAIAKCAEFYTLNALALYLYDLSATANQFYELVHVLDDDNAARKVARLTLISTVARTLKQGLNLLGIQTLERI